MGEGEREGVGGRERWGDGEKGEGEKGEGREEEAGEGAPPLLGPVLGT